MTWIFHNFFFFGPSLLLPSVVSLLFRISSSPSACCVLLRWLRIFVHLNFLFGGTRRSGVARKLEHHWQHRRKHQQHRRREVIGGRWMKLEGPKVRWHRAYPHLVSFFVLVPNSSSSPLFTLFLWFCLLLSLSLHSG